MNSRRKKWAFTENSCRICSKVFCCTGCRKKHETNAHKIYPECNICVSGNHLLTEVNENFLNHLKNSHWPLQCVYCSNQFSSVKELLNRKKCTVGFRKPSLDSPQTPCLPPNIKPLKIVLNDDENDSPLGLLTAENFENRLITSTPMQRGEVLNVDILENIEIHITPVDYNNSDQKESIIKKKTNDNSDNISKRRVTFCDTPVIERESSKKNKNMSNSLNKYPSLEEYPQEGQDQHDNKSEYSNEDNAQNKDSSAQKGPSLTTESKGEIQSRLSWSLQEDNTGSSSSGTFHSAREPPVSDNASSKENYIKEETESNDSMISIVKNLNQMCEEILAAPESGINSGSESDYPNDTDYYKPVLSKQINCEITSSSLKVEVKEDIKFCVIDTADDPQRKNADSTLWESALNISISQDTGITGSDEEKENEGHIKICSVTPSKKKILLEINDTPQEHHVGPLPRTPLAFLPETNLGTNPTNFETGKKSNVIKVKPLSQLQTRNGDFSSESLPNNTHDESTNKDNHETPENIPTSKPSVSVKPLPIQDLGTAYDSTDSSASSINLSNSEEDSLDDSLKESNKSQSLESSTEANTSIWPRVSAIVKNSIQSLFSRSSNDSSFDRSSSLKRHLPDSSYELPVKRQKLVDVKCRPLIRPIGYLFNEQSSSESINVEPQVKTKTFDIKTVKPRVKYVDKATQTELTFHNISL